MAKIQWTIDTFVSIKLSEDLFSIGLLKRSPYLWCFDVTKTDDGWGASDIENAEPLFCVLVGRVVTQRLVTGKIKVDVTSRDTLPEIPEKWIRPRANTAHWEVDNFPWRGGDLIALDPDVGQLEARVLVPGLDVTKNQDVIESCELTNMWGDQDLGDRLRRYFQTGEARDDLKFEIFPALWSDRSALRPLTRRLPVPLR